MNLDREQQHVLNTILRVGHKVGATPTEIRAAVATGIVESRLRNLPGGDADSAGWRQERASEYPDPTNLRASVHRFFGETRAVRGRYSRAGDLAAAVQRPAAQYRGRYQESMGLAKALIRGQGDLAGFRPAPGGFGRQAGAQGGQAANLGSGSGIVASLAGALQASRQGQGVGASAPAVPAFAARPVSAAVMAPSGGVPAGVQRSSLGDQLAAIVQSVDTSSVQKIAGGSGTSRLQSDRSGVQGRTLYIGDSLGVGTEPSLKKLLGGHVDADVVSGRSSESGIAALKQKIGSRGYRQIVLDLGTNDMSADQLARSVQRARKLAPDNVQIFIPTLNGPFATKRKNAVLHELAAKDPRIQLVPWHSKSQGHLAGDGIHATAQGYESRAQLIAEAMGWAPQQVAGGQGQLKITGPNPGRVKPIVVQFGERVSAVLGRPLVASDGSGHSRLTVNGNVSEHTTGNAIDIPLAGRALVAAGRAALVAAGWSAARARKVSGGLFNVYQVVNGKRVRHQIIFNTLEGGDHTNHLHISAAYR